MWMDMLKDRNLTSHTYKEDIADDIYERIITTHIHALKLFSTIIQKYIHMHE